MQSWKEMLRIGSYKRVIAGFSTPVTLDERKKTPIAQIYKKNGQIWNSLTKMNIPSHQSSKWKKY